MSALAVPDEDVVRGRGQSSALSALLREAGLEGPGFPSP